MLITIDGLVTGRREYQDSSCFIDIFTKEYSVVEVLAKGVKKINSPLAQPTGLFAYSAFCFNKKDLRYTINSARCKKSFHKISSDLKSLSLAAYFAELIKFTATPEQDSGDVLKFMLIALTELEHGVNPEQVKSSFEIKLIHALGFSGHESGLTESASQTEGCLLEHLDKSFKTLDYYKSL